MPFLLTILKQFPHSFLPLRLSFQIFTIKVQNVLKCLSEIAVLNVTQNIRRQKVPEVNWFESGGQGMIDDDIWQAVKCWRVFTAPLCEYTTMTPVGDGEFNFQKNRNISQRLQKVCIVTCFMRVLYCENEQPVNKLILTHLYFPTSHK
jgi:hypothetical protein